MFSKEEIGKRRKLVSLAQ